MRTAEIVASRILFWGGVASILLMAAGIILWGAPGAGQAVGPLGKPVGHPAVPPAPVYTSFAEVARAWREWPVEPLAIVTTGILLLLATPLAGVVAVFAVFLAGGERRYAAIAGMLIVALLASLAFVGR